MQSCMFCIRKKPEQDLNIQIASTIFMYGYCLNANILFYITRVRGHGFYERGERYKLLLDIFV
jgi:hypothetical protein